MLLPKWRKLDESRHTAGGAKNCSGPVTLSMIISCFTAGAYRECYSEIGVPL